MFVQPMLLIEEVEQVPHSLCRNMGQDVSVAIWNSFLEDIQSLLKTAQLSDDALQNKIIWARAINGKSDWRAPFPKLEPYQEIAREVQTPVDWLSLNIGDRESLDDYIQSCLSCPIESALRTGAALPGPIYAQTQADKTRLIVPDGLARPFEDVITAFCKVGNRDLMKKIMQANISTIVSLTSSSVSTGRTFGRCFSCAAKCDPLLRCSRCRIAEYCGASCQKTGWKSGHSKECAKFVEVLDIMVPASISDLLKKHRPDTLKVLGQA